MTANEDDLPNNLARFLDMDCPWAGDRCLVFARTSAGSLPGKVSIAKVYFDQKYRILDFIFLNADRLKRVIIGALNVPDGKAGDDFPFRMLSRPIQLSRAKLAKLAELFARRIRPTHVWGDAFGERQQMRVAIKGAIQPDFSSS